MNQLPREDQLLRNPSLMPYILDFVPFYELQTLGRTSKAFLDRLNTYYQRLDSMNKEKFESLLKNLNDKKVTRNLLEPGSVLFRLTSLQFTAV